MSYAQNTTVPADRSRAEIERTLRKAGSQKLGFMHEHSQTTLVFELGGRAVRLTVTVPTAEELMKRAKRLPRLGQARLSYFANARDKEERRRWRVMLLLVKAKLEAIAEGGTTVEREFLADIIVGNGDTVGEILGPDLAALYSKDFKPHLLLGPRV